MSYKTLVAHLKKILEAVDRYAIDEDANKATMKAFWEIGRDVYTYTRETGEQIKNIALDAGAGRGTLEKYVRFYQQYPKGHPENIDGHRLNWSHYAALLYMNDRAARDFYLKNAAQHQWSSHELRLRIRNNYYENRQNEPWEKKKTKAQLKVIRQKLYTYAAKVLKVVDADSFNLDIDVGFNTKMEHKVRLRGVNCPEKGTKKGEQATTFVAQALGVTEEREIPLVAIRSYKSEKFGRYLVDLWYLKGETDKERILSEGKLLNQVLLDNGLAMIVE